MIDCAVCKKPIKRPQEGNVLWEYLAHEQTRFVLYVHKTPCTHVADCYYEPVFLGWLGLSDFVTKPVHLRIAHLKDPQYQWLIQPVLAKVRQAYHVKTIRQDKRQPTVAKHRAAVAKKLRQQRTYLSTRFLILKRDTYRCRLCGVAASDDGAVRLEVDHITPKSRGGTDDLSNLWTLCFACNRGKGTQLL